MQTEVQISSESEECCPPESNVATEGGSLEIQTSSDNVVPPQPTKRPTRQWAAWTREEEESFFTALRQVGKNFEKITCRVQSKNRDQVRHYYYRVVRRMNKLLGPGLCLDAKNSKDTNAAMLRWWSLLEKYSCKASKLHLKPRRFKIFVDALEHQLIKDRKKNMKKRSSQGENCPPPLPSAFPNQNKSSGNDARAVKFVLVDSQNIQKGGQGKGTVVKRNVNTGVSRCCNKGDPCATKATRKRRKNGAVSAATLKRWEKAAMAGVSLVADAAEHLERTAGEKEAERQGASDGSSPQAAGCNNGQAQSPLENSPASVPLESNVQNTMKLKLQLFPIDDSTRKALEMDKHNPHLELTLSTRKKISSVLEHLNRKWGSSSVACGELMLFPFSVQRDNLMGYQRWTHGSIVSAADVYAMIGNPPVFRLRYGWILSTELHSAASQTRSDPSSEDRVYKNYGGHQLGGKTLSPAEFGGRSERLSGWSKNRSEGMRGHVGTARNDPFKSSSFAANILWQISEAAGGTTSREMNDVIDPRVGDKATSAAGEWADSLTNVSVGDLLTDASPDIDTNCVKHPVSGNPRCLDEMPFSCDSFDAAIAAHISRQQRNSIFQSGVACHSSSIWDAEETCDAFSFRKKALSSEHVASSSMATSTAREEFSRTSPEHSGCLHEDSDEVDMDEDTEADPMDECPSKSHEIEHLAKDLSSLTDIYWPDSLGPLELEVPSSKYYSEDMILSDSLSGLNRLIASSMDAFQNCSFFGLDSKGQSTGAGAEVSASSSGQKVGASSSGQKVGASSSGQKVGGGDNAGV